MHAHIGGDRRPCAWKRKGTILAWLFRQHLAVFLAHGDKELVNGYGRVNCNFAAEGVLAVVLLLSGIASRRVREVEKRIESQGDEHTRTAFGACSEIRAVGPLMSIARESLENIVMACTIVRAGRLGNVVCDKLEQIPVACFTRRPRIPPLHVSSHTFRS